MKEQALSFGPDRSLIGILTDPPREARGGGRPAFLFLNSGVLHRVGPNRLHVKLARELAAAGFPGLRFDLSGIGDSPASGGAEGLADRFVRETQEAMDFLKAARNIDRFVLLGNCSGAGVAFLTALADERVCGAAMINPQGQRRVRRYAVRLAKNRKSWMRAFRGALKGDTRDQSPDAPREAPPQGKNLDQEFRGLVADRRRETLLVFCEWDPGLDYFEVTHPEAVRDLRDRESFHVIRGLNHDFDLVAGQLELCEVVSKWAQRFQP